MEERPVYRLDAAEMTSRETAHDVLSRTLGFPPWYGRNLDALYDLLTAMGPSDLVLENPSRLRELGSYGQRLLNTLHDAGQANRHLRLILAEEEADHP